MFALAETSLTKLSLLSTFTDKPLMPIIAIKTLVQIPITTCFFERFVLFVLMQPKIKQPIVKGRNKRLIHKYDNNAQRHTYDFMRCLLKMHPYIFQCICISRSLFSCTVPISTKSINSSVILRSSVSK